MFKRIQPRARGTAFRIYAAAVAHRRDAVRAAGRGVHGADAPARRAGTGRSPRRRRRCRQGREPTPATPVPTPRLPRAPADHGGLIPATACAGASVRWPRPLSRTEHGASRRPSVRKNYGSESPTDRLPHRDHAPVAKHVVRQQARLRRTALGGRQDPRKFIQTYLTNKKDRKEQRPGDLRNPASSGPASR